jgi:hypothetical protein
MYFPTDIFSAFVNMIKIKPPIKMNLPRAKMVEIQATFFSRRSHFLRVENRHAD